MDRAVRGLYAKPGFLAADTESLPVRDARPVSHGAVTDSPCCEWCRAEPVPDVPREAVMERMVTISLPDLLPHCWPQKQQCVLTRRSGSTLVESRTPVIDERCGPNRPIILNGSTGTSATPSYPLLVRHGHSGTATTTPPVPVRTTPGDTSDRPPGSARRRKLIPESELALDGRQVADHRHRGVRLCTSTTDLPVGREHPHPCRSRHRVALDAGRRETACRTAATAT